MGAAPFVANLVPSSDARSPVRRVLAFKVSALLVFVKSVCVWCFLERFENCL